MTNYNQDNYATGTIRSEGVGRPEILDAFEPHLACLMLLDTSSSMLGMDGTPIGQRPIDRLNEGLKRFVDQVRTDPIAMRRIDVAVMRFASAPATMVQDFTPLSQMNPPQLQANGLTDMGNAIDMAIDKVKEQNRRYEAMGTPHYKSWIFMITDGAPTDSITKAKVRIADQEHKGRLKFWAIGVPGYDQATLANIVAAKGRAIALNDKDFTGIFDWASNSMVTIMESQVGLEPEIGQETYNPGMVEIEVEV